MSAAAAALAADLGSKALRGVLLAAVAFSAYTYTRYLSVKADMAENTAQTALQQLETSKQVIERQDALIRAQERLAASLDGQRTALRELANTREIHMRKLLDENAEIRAWAAVPVPADVVRLRDHGTITGAAAYRQFMSQGAALPAARRAGEE